MFRRYIEVVGKYRLDWIVTVRYLPVVALQELSSKSESVYTGRINAVSGAAK